MNSIEQIKQILLNNKGISNKEVANTLGVSIRQVSATYAQMVRSGLMPRLTPKVAKTPSISKGAKPTKLKKAKVVINTYSNTDGVKKQEARDKIEKAILVSNSFDRPILTLPFHECKLEIQLLQNISNKLKFLGCEMNDETYNRMLMTISSKNLPISTHKGMIGEVIAEAKENQFSNLILDYCGQFGTNHIDIGMAITNNIVGIGGAICITANKRISPNTFAIYEQMERLNPKIGLTDETRCVHAITTFIGRIGGFRYAIESIFDYNDGIGKNMVLIIIRRIA
jgi:hypothetical protein